MGKNISVMIVDDERLAIEDLSTLVDWNDLGFEIVTTAFNGTQALMKYEAFHPQVVFTDIKMPFMDGIELIERLRTLDPDVKLVLLTAFEDFSYARSAIQQGITDYLIKSEINTTTLTELLNKISCSIQKQSQYQGILADKKVESFFMSKSNGETHEDNELFSGRYSYLIFEQNEPVMLSDELVSAYRRITGNEMAAVLRKLDYGVMDLKAVSVLPKRRTLVCLASESTSMADSYRNVYTLAKKGVKNLAEKFSCWFSVYASYYPMNFYEIQSLLHDNKLFNQKYFKATQEPIELRREKRVKHQEEPINIQLVTVSYQNKDLEELNKQLDVIFTSLCRNGSVRQLSMVSQDLYYLLCNFAKALDPEKSDRVDLSPDHNWHQWLCAQTICQWMKQKFGELLDIRCNVSDDGYTRVVNDAILFIHQNYTNPELSLQEIANHLHLSVGYLCALFKEETGKTLKNYITDVRIGEAKKLLEKDYLKIYEICTATGYQSSQYFSQVFHKKVGVYPAEYRKGVRNET